jgi:hypothetical protein
MGLDYDSDENENKIVYEINNEINNDKVNDNFDKENIRFKNKKEINSSNFNADIDKNRDSIVSYGRKFSLKNFEEDNFCNEIDIEIKEDKINKDFLTKDILNLIEEIKKESLEKINLTIKEKSNEIKILKQNIELINNEMLIKEKNCEEKKSELQSKIQEYKYINKKTENENNTLNEFISNCQNDIICLQEQVEKKSIILFVFYLFFICFLFVLYLFFICLLFVFLFLKRKKTC